MNKFFRNLLAYSTMICVVLGSLVACSKDDTTPGEEPEVIVPELTIPGISENGELANAATSWNSASVKIATTSIVEYAWVLQTAAQTVPSEAVIFKTGTVVVPEGAESTIELTDLARLTDYQLCIAAKVPATENATKAEATEYYGEVITVKFSTPDYSDELTVVKVKQDGFDLHLKFPADVTERGNVLKWGVANLVMYNSNKQNGQSDARTVMLNDEAYPLAIIKNDTTFVIEENNRYIKDENGDYVLDEWSGEYVYYWDFIAPGEPLVFLISEFGWGESDWGWGEGWYQMPFDEDGYYNAVYESYWSDDAEPVDEEQFWNEGAYHKKIQLTTLPPAEYEHGVEVATEDLAPNGGMISITPDPESTCFCMGVMDHATYTQIVDQFLGGDESLMQWFSTSYYAQYTGVFSTWYTNEIVEYYEGTIQIPMSEYFWELVPGSTYHIITNSMAGKPSAEDPDYLEPDPMKQNYQHFTFDLPDYTLEASEITVTGLPATSAYKVGFNVKCTNYDVAPVAEIAYAMNYVREFNMELEYSTYEEIVGWNRGYAGFSEEEIAAVNSAEGYDVWFDARENSTSRLAVMGWNTEGRPSTFEGENPSAVADAKSASIPAAEPVESELFEELAGEWTATATVSYQAYGDPDGDGVNGYYMVEKEMKSKVVIGEATCPETLTDDVYALYEEFGVSPEMTDAYFAELKNGVAEFNQSVRGQNRILCTGWDFNANASAYYSELECATPWDLFINPDYNAAYVEPLMYEFGPKWFLQVAADGSVFVPVNTNRVAPLTAWVNSYAYHLVGANATEGVVNATPESEEDLDNVSKWPNLPVEVSEDKQTITVKAYEKDGITYYPNVMYETSWGPYLYSSKINSDVVLTKGWTGADEETDVEAVRKAAKNAKVDGVKVKNNNNAEINVISPKARTAFFKTKKVTKFYDGKAVTFEEVNSKMKNLVEKTSVRK
ncbi:MAG: hypothetical protein IKY82_07350 [Alistipes sp.]|nr:hypothetical protein [Alistipes sp.]